MNRPSFSVIVPTRNRPAALLRAVGSVISQQIDGVEVVVVDDGSEPEVAAHLAKSLEQLTAQTGSSIEYIELGNFPRGRGPAYARNVGCWSSTGQYLAFLDDDDLWYDNHYLATALKALSADPDMDLLYANQVAVPEEGGPERALWLHSLGGILERQGRELKLGCFRIGAKDLMTYQGFCHLNTSLVRRDLFNAVGGFNEYLRYEEDLDFYLRCVDQAKGILHMPALVARHHVPDSSQAESASQSITQIQRLEARRQLLLSNSVAARNTQVGGYCRKHLCETGKHLTQLLLEQGEVRAAYMSAKEALAYGATLRWFAYTAYLGSRYFWSKATA